MTKTDFIRPTATMRALAAAIGLAPIAAPAAPAATPSSEAAPSIGAATSSAEAAPLTGAASSTAAPSSTEAAPSTAATAAAGAGAAEAANRALVTEYVEGCLNASDDRCLERFLLAENVPAIRKSEQLRRHHFPDLRYRVLEVLADGDRVVAMLEVTGQREGTGAAAGEEDEPGEAGERRLKIREALFYSVRDGRLHEGELVSDLMGVARALGYRVEPPPEE